MRWRASWLAIGWLQVTAIVFLSLAPDLPGTGIELGDKLGHLLAYGTLQFWFCQLYASRRARIGYGAGFAAMGVALEFVQGWLGYRDFELFDMGANALGVLIGWSLALAAGARVFVRIESLFTPR